MATVIDIASRRVVGYAMADHLRTELPAAALANAIAARDPGPGVIFHSDRGCQYTSAEFAALASDCDVALSAGRTGQCWDNALAESFFRLDQRRAARPADLADPGHGPPRHRRVHRLVQRHPAAQHPRLPQPRRIRRRQQDQEDSLTKSSALSVKAGQPHDLIEGHWRVHIRKLRNVAGPAWPAHSRNATDRAVTVALDPPYWSTSPASLRPTSTVQMRSFWAIFWACQEEAFQTHACARSVWRSRRPTLGRRVVLFFAFPIAFTDPETHKPSRTRYSPEKSQIRALLSAPPVASSWPSGLNATVVTAPS